MEHTHSHAGGRPAGRRLGPRTQIGRGSAYDDDGESSFKFSPYLSSPSLQPRQRASERCRSPPPSPPRASHSTPSTRPPSSPPTSRLRRRASSSSSAVSTPAIHMDLAVPDIPDRAPRERARPAPHLARPRTESRPPRHTRPTSTPRPIARSTRRPGPTHSAPPRTARGTRCRRTPPRLPARARTACRRAVGRL